LRQAAWLAFAMVIIPSARAADAIITLTINPEARLSATVIGTVPATIPCARPITLPISVINQAFVTASLEAVVVDGDDTVTLDFTPDRLTGASRENRNLHLIVSTTELVDITLAFKIQGDVPDLGGRDRIHFLMRCRA
jgi:hypothetical protein